MNSSALFRPAIVCMSFGLYLPIFASPARIQDPRSLSQPRKQVAETLTNSPRTDGPEKALTQHELNSLGSEALLHQDTVIRSAACSALIQLATPIARPMLVTALQDEEVSVPSIAMAAVRPS